VLLLLLLLLCGNWCVSGTLAAVNQHGLHHAGPLGCLQGRC
jgi:hypothetical protein